MKSKESDRLISKFKSYAKRGGAVLLGVQGGRSSEGADYLGDQMNSVASSAFRTLNQHPK